MDMPSGSSRYDNTRVSDAERDQAVAELSGHFQAGRLTQEEFDDRSGRALQARTRSDLATLFTDLPRRAAATAPGPGPAASPALAIGHGGMQRASHLPVVRVVIACAVAALVAGNLLGGPGHFHTGFWLVPAVIFCFALLRPRSRR